MLRIRIWFIPVLIFLLANLAYVISARAQAPSKRLILKDGSYQVVTQYKVTGDRVHYYSAERGDWEELPSDLVDWVATGKWDKEHVPGVSPGSSSKISPGNAEAAEIDKEEQQDRAEQDASTPEVAAELHLPDEDGVWALDTYHDKPELVALAQNAGNVNKQTGHNVLRAALNPLGSTKRAIEIPGATSKIHLHVTDPSIYVGLTAKDSELTDPGSSSAGDTRGGGSGKDKNAYSSSTSQYAIVRVQSNPRRDYRVVSAVKISMTGNVSQTEDVIPATAQVLPGKHWMKLTTGQPLKPGDYALMEILAPGEINAAVWDFCIDPQAPENKGALIPANRSVR